MKNKKTKIKGMKKKEKHRILYANWRNSHLSIARFSGGCILNGKEYSLDFKNCEKKIIDGKEKYFPDLVEI